MNEPLNKASLDEIDLGALGRKLRQNVGWVVGVTAIGVAASFALGKSFPSRYEALATLMPTAASEDRFSSAFAPLAEFAPSGVIPRGNGEKFIALLESRVLAERVISRHHFLPQLGAPSSPGGTLSLGEAQQRLRGMVAVAQDKVTGIIEVAVQHEDAHVSAGIANAYIDELEAFLKDNSFTAARRQREFLQKQVEDLTGELQTIESQLIAFQEQHQLVSLDAQTQATIQTYATLKSQLIAKEMELKLQERSVSPEDVELLGLKHEVTLLREELAALETGAAGGMVAFQDAPQLAVRYGQFQRDLTVKQKVYELLTQQLELAKIQETRDALSFQVIDRASVPDFAKNTARKIVMVVGTLVSLALGILLALGLKSRSTPRRKRPRPADRPVSQRMVPITREGL